MFNVSCICIILHMGKTEIIIFLVLANAVFLILIAGVFMFVFKYRKRKIEHGRELETREEQHKLQLANTQLNVQQQTMQYIGREIHDSVAQKLTLASIYTGQMHNRSTEPEIVKPLENVIKIINDSLTELRQLSHSLTDTRKQNASLAELIAAECENVNDTGKCNLLLSVRETPVMDIAAKSSLFRIVQEFIQNSLKYSECAEIKIDLSSQNNSLVMSLEDNGKGFDLDERKHKGIGLDNMRRRALALNGHFEMESSPGNGTKLRISVPEQNLLSAK